MDEAGRSPAKSHGPSGAESCLSQRQNAEEAFLDPTTPTAIRSASAVEIDRHARAAQTSLEDAEVRLVGVTVTVKVTAAAGFIG